MKKTKGETCLRRGNKHALHLRLLTCGGSGVTGTKAGVSSQWGVLASQRLDRQGTGNKGTEEATLDSGQAERLSSFARR